MSFDFDAAVGAPFRMQPGLRRIASGSPQLTPLTPGARHQREKLAVLSAFWPQALCAQQGFDAGPAIAALCRHAAAEHPQAWAWDGEAAQALHAAIASMSPAVLQYRGLAGVREPLLAWLAARSSTGQRPRNP